MTGSELPEEKVKAFLSALTSANVRVLWKWESETMPGKPASVMLKKWLPQQDVLGHPNVRLFVTHGGMGSMIEAVYHGKPVMAIPGFGDQFATAARAERIGLGLALRWNTLTEEMLRFVEDERMP